MTTPLLWDSAQQQYRSFNQIYISNLIFDKKKSKSVTLATLFFLFS